MAHAHKKKIEFECENCEEGFLSSKYYKVTRSGDFKHYKAVSPCCNKSSKSVRDEPLPISRGVDRRSPTMDERDFGSKMRFVNPDKEKVKQAQKQNEDNDKPKSSGIKVGKKRKKPNIPMRKISEDG